MKKPKYVEKRKIDSWICCWCGEDNDSPVSDFDYDTGDGIGICRKCGEENHVMFSIEFISQPVED